MIKNGHNFGFDESNNQGREIQNLLEHLTLQNDAYSSSSRLLMKCNNNLKSQTNNLINLLKVLICITSKGDEYYSFRENEQMSKLVNSCRVSWFESLYSFLSITENTCETVLISPILFPDKEERCGRRKGENKYEYEQARGKQEYLSESKFELNINLVDCAKELNVEDTVKLFYSNVLNSLNLIHNSSSIKRFIREILMLLFKGGESCVENLDGCQKSEDPLFNIYFVKLKNNSTDSEEGIIVSNSNEINLNHINEGLEFINLSKYFCFERCIVFNRCNLRFLVLNRTHNLCWSDRISDINTQFLQDYTFLFNFDNPRRKLIFNIISSFNKFISNFVTGSLDQLNVDKSSFCLNGSTISCEDRHTLNDANTSCNLPNNENNKSLTINEAFEKILLFLTENNNVLNSVFLSPNETNSMSNSGNEGSNYTGNCSDFNKHTSIISSINSFATCVSQGVSIDKINVSSSFSGECCKKNETSDFPIFISISDNNNQSDCSQSRQKRSNSEITTLSEFLRDDFEVNTPEIKFEYNNDNNEALNSKFGDKNVSIDFFYDDNLHTCEWILL
ncbi:hypothetical protein FG386_000485 [Cryptosporidium ryanae]|uniref:uncharacterized protein n=1 Tax=Cryptosporidium ryanae TaxID=515981 RepID=UPI00351A4824|nr:hypothetical protein FG386_000485 [Cryptosporidium ryanae]